VYVNPGSATLASPNVPSPSRSQSYVSAPPSGSLEVLPSNATSSGAGPWSGVAVARAIGWLLPAGYAIRRIVPPSRST
jgi:hypothetical protein